MPSPPTSSVTTATPRRTWSPPAAPPRKRALAASGSRYAKLVERAPLPVVGAEGKARIVAAERRVAEVVGEGVARIAQGYDRGIEFVSGQALKGLETFAQRTDWAKDMFVVDTVRRINLPAAKLSLKIASRIDDAAEHVERPRQRHGRASRRQAGREESKGGQARPSRGLTARRFLRPATREGARAFSRPPISHGRGHRQKFRWRRR